MTPDFIRKYHIYKLLLNTSETSCISRLTIKETLLNIYNDYHHGESLYKGLLKTNDKTIRRDVKDIASFFGIEIGFKRYSGHYLISDNLTVENSSSIINKIELFLLCYKDQYWKPHITPTKTLFNPNLDILGIINAISQTLYISISCNGWYGENSSAIINKNVQPLHIRAHNNAWYLWVNDDVDGLKLVCLDSSVTAITLTNLKVKAPKTFSTSTFKEPITTFS